MAIDTERQSLIHLHTAEVKAPVQMLNLGEIAVQHDSTSGAALYVETVLNGDANSLAKFITEKAIDAKIKVVSDAVSANTSAIAAEKERAEGVEGGLKERLDAVEVELGLNGGEATGVSVTERVVALEGAVGKAAEDETPATGLFLEVNNLKVADAQIRADFAAADSGLSSRIDTEKGRIDTLTGRVSTAETNITNLQTAVGKAAEGETPATGLYKAIADVEAKHVSELESATEELGGQISAIQASANANTTAISNMDKAYKEADTQIRTDFAAADNTVRGEFAAADNTVRGEFAAADKALQDQIDELETAVENAQKSATTVVSEGTDAGNNLEIVESAGTDGNKVFTINLTDVASAQALANETTARTEDIKTVNESISAMDEAYKAADSALTTSIETQKGRVDTLVGTDVNKSVRTIASEELAAQLIPESAKESLDTLQEIAAWIQQHPEDASEMNAAIEANAAAIEALNTEVGDPASGEGETAKAATGIYAIIENNEKVVSESLTDLDDRVKANATAIATNASAITETNNAATALTTRVTTAEGKITTLEGNISTVSGDVNTLKTNMSTVSGDVNTLKATVGNAESGLVKDVADNTDRIEALEGSAVKAVTGIEGVSVSNNTIDFSAMSIDCGTY